MDDLRVTDILSQMVSLSEAYMQIYELKQVQGDAHASKRTMPRNSKLQ